MYSYLSGKLIKIVDSGIVLDVNGIGYEVQVPVRTIAHLPAIGSLATIYTYLHVREDAHALFGFISEEEKELFKLLLGVTGIGPKLAMAIISGIGPYEFKTCIEGDDEDYLSTIPGIGRKTASRLILELKEKIQKFKFVHGHPKDKHGLEKTELTRDALMALISLGFQRPVAQNAIENAFKKSENKLSLEELIKSSIKYLQGST